MHTSSYFVLLCLYFPVCKVEIFTKDSEEDHFLCYTSFLLGLGHLTELHHL